MTDKKTYRPDIDGLRAIAVLAVVIFHIEPAWVPGGFVGVDMFFVISGFLITGIITRQVEDGSFSFFEFYRRRIKRIVPVLTCVILVTLVVGQLLFLPEDLERLSLSALSSQFFVGNVYFTYFLDTSYFADDASLEPLLHIWSLGVEEQFYLLWPVTLVWLLALPRRWVPMLLVVLVSAASFFLPVAMPSIDAMFLYYMLPGRVGELFAGVLCYFATRRGIPLRGDLYAWAGLVLIALSLGLLSSDNLFPGLRGIPVSLGTALLIYGGTKANIVSRALSVRMLVWIGLISYSLYLWHWPVLAYLKYLDANLSLVVKMSALVGMTVLSYLSYRFVEQPFRMSEHSFGRVFARQFLIPTMLVSSITGFFIFTNGYGLFGLTSDYAEALAKSEEPGRSSISDDRVCLAGLLTEDDTIDPDCLINGETGAPALLWGDSNASHYVGALGLLAERYGFSFRNLAHSACPPVLGEPQAFASERYRERCGISSTVARRAANDFDTLILGAAWDVYLRRGREAFEEAFAETISQLIRSGKQVVILGIIPRIETFDRECERKAIKVEALNCEERNAVSDKRVRRVNERVKLLAEANGATYLDFNDPLCREGTCSASVDGSLLYYSQSHLSAQGSERLGELLIGSETASRLVKRLNAEER